MIVNENTYILGDMAAFDWVADHLIEQDTQSKDNGGGCLYRGPEGTACAVGCLISDKDYEEWFENTAVDDDHIIEAVTSSNPVWRIEDKQIHMLMVLQYIHDNHTPYTWQYDFDSLRMVLFPDGRNYDPDQVMSKRGIHLFSRNVKEFVQETISIASEMRKR
jgi:hypothetical protein